MLTHLLLGDLFTLDIRSPETGKPQTFPLLDREASILKFIKDFRGELKASSVIIASWTERHVFQMITDFIEELKASTVIKASKRRKYRMTNEYFRSKILG